MLYYFISLMLQMLILIILYFFYSFKPKFMLQNKEIFMNIYFPSMAFFKFSCSHVLSAKTWTSVKYLHPGL